MAYYKCGKIFATQNSNTSIETASGAIANFRTSLSMPVLGCNAEFSASQASGTPTPASPIPIVGVDKVNFVLSGKNQLAKPFIYEGGTDLNLLSECFFIKEGTYRFSFDTMTNANNWRFLVRTKDSNGNDLSTSDYISVSSTNWSATRKGWLSNTNITAKAITITLNQDCYIRVLFCLGDTSASSVASNQMLELGSTATDYEPYNGKTALINLGGTYHGGSVDAVTGKITLTHKKYVFDENLPQSSFGLTAVTGYTQLSYSPYINEGKANTVFLSDKFEFETGNVHSVYKCWNTTSVPRMFLALPDTVETKEDAISWFENNPTEVIAELATPIVVYASNTAELYTKAGLNNIFCDTGDIEVKYRKLHSDN